MRQILRTGKNKNDDEIQGSFTAFRMTDLKYAATAFGMTDVKISSHCVQDDGRKISSLPKRKR